MAQAVASDASISGSRSRAAGLGFGFTGDLLVFAGPCLFEGAVVGIDAPGFGVGAGQGFGGLAAVCLQGGAQVCGLQLRLVQAPGLHAGQGDERCDDAEDGQLDAKQAAQALARARAWRHRVPAALAVVVWG